MTPAIPVATSSHGPWLAPTTLLLLAILLLGFRLGAEPVGRSSERRCHEVARAMVESGDYLVPMLNGEPRLQKPPLYYWLASLGAHAHGGASLLTTRLPSALAALGLLALVIGFTTRLRDRSTGLLAGALLLISFQFSTSGRRGDAEMWLALSSFAAIVAFDRHAETGSRRALVAFGACLAVAFLAKATAAFATVVAPVAVLLALRDARGRASIAGAVAAIAAASIVGFAWYGWVLARVPGAWNDLLGDLFLPFGVRAESNGDAEHFEPPWYFARQFFSIAFPTCLLLPVVAHRLRATRGHSNQPPLRRFLLTASVQFVVFSALPQKQKHYLLPLLPLYVVLTVDALRSASFSPLVAAWIRRSIAYSGAATILAAGIIVAGTATFDPSNLLQSVPLLGTAAILGFWLVRRAEVASFRANVAAFAVMIALILADHHGRFEPWRNRLDDAADSGGALPDEQRLRDAAARHPLLARIFDVDDAIEDADEVRRDDRSAHEPARTGEHP